MREAEREKAEQAEYETKLERREARVKSRGDRSRPTGGVREQINLTDEESESSRVEDLSYNAQAVVDNETLLIVSNHVSQKTNDKKELTPAEALKAPESLGRPQEFLADNGYFSESNGELAEKMTPYIADSQGTFGKPGSPGQDAHEVEKMKHRLKTPTGRSRAQVYARTCFWDHQIGADFDSFRSEGSAVDLVSIWNLKRICGAIEGHDRGLLSPVGHSDLS